MADSENSANVTSTNNETLQAYSALFSSKVRNMVSQYKEHILDLENQIREVVAENFKYLDIPEPNYITKIVEKHIANMQAEILGIKEDLTYFELSKLNLPNYPLIVLMKPVDLNFGDRYGMNGCRNRDFLLNIIDKHYYYLAGYEFNVILTRRQKLFSTFYHSQNLCFSDNYKKEFIDKILTISNSGSITNLSEYNGYGIPCSGFYTCTIDKEKWEYIYNRYQQYDSVKLNRVYANGEATNETNSDILILPSSWNSIGSYMKTGYFMEKIGGSHLNITTNTNWGYIGASAFLSHVYSFGYGCMANIGRWADYPEANRDKIFYYYWTWEDEVGNADDIEKIKLVIMNFFQAFYRFKRGGDYTKDLTDEYQLLPNNLPHLLPKGCRHQEAMFKAYREKADRGFANSKDYLIFVLYNNYKSHYEYNIKYFGVSDTEAQEDKNWYYEAYNRGEPLYNLQKALWADGDAKIKMFKEWGHFYFDQLKYHTAQNIANQAGATQEEILTYTNLKKWFYTKYDHLRNKSGTEKIEILSNTILKNIENDLNNETDLTNI